MFNFLLPYIEQTALDQAAKTCADYFTGSAIPQGSVWAVVNGKYVHAHPIPAYKCPDERMQTADGGSAATYQAANESAYGNYAANLGLRRATKQSVKGARRSPRFETARATRCSSPSVTDVRQRRRLSGPLAWANLWSDSNQPWLPSYCMNKPLTTRTDPYEACKPFQVSPNPLWECDVYRAESPHSGGMNVGVGDGSVRFVGESIDQTIWANLCDPRRQRRGQRLVIKIRVRGGK